MGIIIDNFSMFVQNNPTKKVSTVTPTHPISYKFKLEVLSFGLKTASDILFAPLLSADLVYPRFLRPRFSTPKYGG